MSAQHTPGPWFLEISGAERMVISETGRDPDGEQMLVCDLFRGGYIYDETGAQLDANARLIAAAPELLEALEAIIADCGHEMMDGYVENSIHSREVALAKAAIAKARGEVA